MKSIMNKLTNPERIAELSPADTLKRIGLKQNDILCDIGAGTGVFTIPAAEITGNTVYAVDLNRDLLDFIDKSASEKDLDNIRTVLSDGVLYEVPDESADIAMVVTVLHEIADKRLFMKEIKRILRHNGKLAIIEFHKRKTPMGPPEDHRISEDDVNAYTEDAGFTKTDSFILGENFYCSVFQSAKK